MDRAGKAALFVALVALGGCARGRDPAAAAKAPVPRKVGVPEIKAMTKDPSAKLILVNVWATWCAPCREELPSLVKLQHEMGSKGLKVVLVSADTNVPSDKLTDFLTAQG